jgi:hypothetical protein
VEELERDVVRIAEDHHGVGHRAVGVDDSGVLDAEFVEPGRPRVEIRAAGNPK